MPFTRSRQIQGWFGVLTCFLGLVILGAVVRPYLSAHPTARLWALGFAVLLASPFGVIGIVLINRSRSPS